jgi:hypothetical protein
MSNLGDYNFMRSGEDLATDSINNSRGTRKKLEVAKLFNSVILIFVEDAIRMATAYKCASGLETSRVGVETLIKCLKARARCGVRLDSGSDFTTRVSEVMGRLGNHHNRPMTAQAPIDTASNARIVEVVDRLCSQYVSWQPVDLFNQGLKMSIDRACMRMSENGR